MAGSTTRLGLYKPGGGSTGLILPDETADIDKINSNMDLIDAAVGARNVTSVSRPATPFDGQTIYETDTRNTMVWSAGATRWNPVGIPNAAGSSLRDALFPSPAQGSTVMRTDLGYFETYYAAYNAGSNPQGARVAGWYPGDEADVFFRVVRGNVQNIGASSTAVAVGMVGGVGLFGDPYSHLPMTLAGSLWSNGMFTWDRSTGIFKVLTEGRYDLSALTNWANIAVVAQMAIMKNSATLTNTANNLGSVDEQVGTSATKNLLVDVHDVPLLTTDEIRIVCVNNTAAGSGFGFTPHPASAHFSMRWSGVNHA